MSKSISKTIKIGALRSYVLGSTLLSSLLILLIFASLAQQSWPALYNAWDSILTTKWQPSQNHYGIVSMLYGSFIVTCIAMALALPIGVFAAIHISEIRTTRLRKITKSALEILAGIPSIVYGLIGVSFLSVWVENLFELSTGRVILTASILLAVMILPTILSLAEEAISNVPEQYRENALALGLYPYEMMKDGILPIAAADIIGAALLALGRALGETMAVMLVIGSIDRLPSPLFNLLSSGQTVTSKIGREIGESAFGSTHFNVLILMSLILVITTLGLTIASQVIIRRSSKNA